jgi:OPA family glycerol-3-phosphate transporter-like MFS transporter
MAVGAAAMIPLLDTPALGWLVIVMSLAIIGVHGMLSGTASADFGGAKNAGLVTGIIDGFVYLGGGAQAFLYAQALPSGDAAKLASNWRVWPGAMLPIALVGLLLCATIWNARPTKHAAK